MLQSVAATRRRFWSLLRPRISLRLMLALVTIFCIWLGVHLQRTKEQARIARRLSLNSGTVYYDYMRGPLPATTYRGPLPATTYPLESVPLTAGGEYLDSQRRSSAPAWLLKSLGEDFIHRVVAVRLRDCDHLRDLHGLPGLETIVCNGRSINDGDIEHVARLRQLRLLLATGGDSELTDESLARLAKLPRLEGLELSGSFTAAGIAALARSPSLKRIVINDCDTSVTPEIAAAFNRSRVQKLKLYRREHVNTPAGYSIQKDAVIVEW